MVSPSLKREIFFEAKLSDILGNPITTYTNVEFKLYNHPDAEEHLYSTGKCRLSGNKEGFLSTVIGSECGAQINNSLFINNVDLYLGITVGNDSELAPRKKIPNVGFAQDAYTLRGFPVGSDVLSVPYINQDGDMLIGSEYVGFRSTHKSSEFLITSANSLTLQSAGLGDVVLEATGSGDIKLKTGKKGRIGGLTLINSGNVGIGTDVPVETLDIFADDADIKLTSENYLESSAITLSKKSRDAALVGGDKIGQIIFEGLDLAGLTQQAAIIGAEVESNEIGDFSGRIGFFTSDDSLSPVERVRITSGGNVGIGTKSPNARLEVSGAAIITGKLQLSTSSTNNIGLNLNTASEGPTCSSLNNGDFGFDKTNNRIFWKGVNGTCSYWNRTGTFDIAEHAPASEPLEPGDVLVIDTSSDRFRVKKSSSAYESSLLGIESSDPTLISNPDQLGPQTFISKLALAGRVLTKVTNEKGPIRKGDYLTSSSTRGFAMKATKAGPVIGKALEDFDNDQGKILVMVDLVYYNPGVTIYSAGDAIIEPLIYDGNFTDVKNANLESTLYKVRLKTGELITNVGAFSESVVGKLKAGFVETENAIINNTLQVSRLFVSEKIVSPVIETKNIVIEEKAKVNELEVTSIKPSTQNLEIDLSQIDKAPQDKGPLAELIIKGLEGKTVASVDSSGNATFSGELTAREASIAGVLTARELRGSEATVSGKLVAREIESENINSLTRDLLSTQTNISSQSSSLASLTTNVNDVQKLLAEIKNQPHPDPTYYQNLEQDFSPQFEQLTVTGSTNLYSLTVSNSILTGSLLIEADSVISLSSELKLSALSSVNFFGGAVIIAKDGTITSKGTFVAEAGIKTNRIDPLTEGEEKYTEATQAGAIIASSENFEKNGIFAPAIETKTAMAGIGRLDQNTTEVVVYNSNIQEDTLIYITPTSPVNPPQLSIAEKKSCESSMDSTSSPQAGSNNNSCKSFFKVAVDKAYEFPVHFNWLIIN
ncbi:hypothetical protein HYW87_02855 [Candidatus Roizmanbacteria bacterium]|nr:hypothetical protein [Candidatus Roizmanbacteria bacterium]